jgi:hypothetical protein
MIGGWEKALVVVAAMWQCVLQGSYEAVMSGGIGRAEPWCTERCNIFPIALCMCTPIREGPAKE